MSRRCDLTGKKSQTGKKVTKAWGVKYRSIRHRHPNLVKTTVLVNGIKTAVKVSTKALKGIKLGKYAGIESIKYTKSE